MSEEKTESPTAARIREARRKGQVVKSQELSSAVTITASFAVLVALVPLILKQTIALIQFSLLQLPRADHPLNELRKVIGSVMGINLTALVPAMLCAMVAALLLNLSTIGVGVSPDAIKPDLSKLNPLNTLKRWFSRKTAMEAVKLGLKTWASLYFIWEFWKEEYRNLLTTSRPDPFHFGPHFEATLGLCWKLIGVQFLFGVIDFAIQYYEHYRNLKMTKQEVRDEHKKQEGDPMIKAQRRARARKMLQSAGLHNLDKASVVVTNPTHLAVALEFNMDMAVPKVICKGADHIAFEIRRRAKLLNIPTVEDKPLARALFPLQLDQTIPPELFRTVAELLLTVRDAEEYF